MAFLTCKPYSKAMKKAPKITIINNEDMRGILAPSSALSKKTLDDVVDFIELSSEKSAQESAMLVKDADRKKSWIPLDEVRKSSDKAD